MSPRTRTSGPIESVLSVPRHPARGTGRRSMWTDSLSLCRAMSQPAFYGGNVRVAVRETHGSWVFLAGDRAYKLKKPVRLGFLDYSSVELRRSACETEVAVNQSLAPGVYLGVRPVLLIDGARRLGPLAMGTAEPIDYVVEMVRFDEHETLAALVRAGRVSGNDIVRVARLIERFHAGAVAITDLGGEAQVLSMWEENLEQMRELESVESSMIDASTKFARAFLSVHGSEVRRRLSEGRIRDGHGDLRAEHIVMGERILVVDRIEFDASLRGSDVASDLAFLVMDLHRLGASGLADVLVGAYRSAGGDCGSDGLLSFYAAYRSQVRAKVSAIAAREVPARDRGPVLAAVAQHWRLGQHFAWRARRPLMIIICGPAASGKSVLAGALASVTGLATLSSDVLRKDLAGLRPDQRAPGELYAPDIDLQTYVALGRAASRSYADGGAVIDATCRRRSDRAGLLGGLGPAGKDAVFVQLRVSPGLATRRAADRLRDRSRISDATPELARQQARDFEPLDEIDGGSLLALSGALHVDGQIERLGDWLDGRATAP